jgi:tetratricopeptide (TPR) repeat protein
MLAPTGCIKTDPLFARDDHKNEHAPTTNLETPAGVDVPPIRIVDRTEVDLVEEMLLHRAMYGQHLRALIMFYSEIGDEEKANWARNELRDYHHIKPYMYLRDAETPVASLRPSDSIAAADKIYDEAVALMEKGGHGTPVFYNQQILKQSLAKFKDLINRYPSSDKIDDAAFFIGELHKEYFEEKDNTLALQWYQRALDWNPDIQRPVRFQMAVIYDYRIHEREKALEMYQGVIDHEDFNKSNVAWAKAAINKLLEDRPAPAPEEPRFEDRPALAATPPPTGEETAASPNPRDLP